MRGAQRTGIKTTLKANYEAEIPPHDLYGGFLVRFILRAEIHVAHRLNLYLPLISGSFFLFTSVSDREGPPYVAVLILQVVRRRLLERRAG